RVAVPACDPCTGQPSFVCRIIPQVQEICTKVIRPVAEQHVEKYAVAVPTVRPERQAVTGRGPTPRGGVCTERGPGATLRAAKQVYTACVPVTRKEVETYQVPVTELRPKVETYTECVCEQRPEVRTRLVPVTVCRTFTEVVAERVPCTVAVRVPYQVVVCVPVCGCP